mmetsp:Transcript_98399/g.175212  ORF Transcript_98399/g.175212 Transcript_98399/m.175212 type:complete len:207 (-) Transcript_98399:11-631(-)
MAMARKSDMESMYGKFDPEEDEEENYQTYRIVLDEPAPGKEREMTREQRMTLVEVFQRLDKDKKRRLGKKAVGKLFVGLGQFPTDDELKTMLKEVPKCGLDVEGCINFFTKHYQYDETADVPPTTYEEMVEMFQTFEIDTENPDLMHIEDFYDAMQSMDRKEVKKMLKLVKIDKYDKFNYKDLARELTRPIGSRKRIESSSDDNVD